MNFDAFFDKNRAFFDDFRRFFLGRKSRRCPRKCMKSLDFLCGGGLKNLGSFCEIHFSRVFRLSARDRDRHYLTLMAITCDLRAHKTTRAATCGPPDTKYSRERDACNQRFKKDPGFLARRTSRGRQEDRLTAN
jgi:hypothetical protein